ncbi:MAG: UDP-N-acetylglucosamine 2-epimerase (non-hydrolyzing) [Acidobacteria bacterium]|nr:UDP-N-acetylglucosamine 2-epimerase (non-hydrolyzing) [Acidobacteriota bacterium]MBS1865477.1 UDP-N-acetylglucosamine 2-epimerase (non-hydrolyzing) [Acidobacteriota bacterium]
MRILTVFGTRPEAIKMAPIIRAARAAKLEMQVCVTAQHRDMLDQMLRVFDIAPARDLNLMQENQTPLQFAARVFESLPPVLHKIRPDWLLVQGDTTTAFSAAFVAFQEKIRVGHVEAGLRTGDKHHPFPEEMNRRLISSLADLNFAPTPRAAANLRAEGISDSRILVTGNTVVDALNHILSAPVSYSDPRLEKLSGKILLVTAHRRENFGAPLEQICAAIRTLAQKFPELSVVLPVHPNPSVRAAVTAQLANRPRILLTDPLSYPEFVHLMKRAALILSDSGGVQEESPTVHTPVLVMRDVTERPEAIESGWAQLVGTSKDEIVSNASAWLSGQKAAPPANTLNPFGDGHAAEKILRALSVSN